MTVGPSRATVRLKPRSAAMRSPSTPGRLNVDPQPMVCVIPSAPIRGSSRMVACRIVSGTSDAVACMAGPSRWQVQRVARSYVLIEVRNTGGEYYELVSMWIVRRSR